MAYDLPPESRVANYVRVSTEEQKEGWSPKDQDDTLKEVARENGWRVVSVCQDLGDSGAFLDRVGMDEARDLAEAGGIDAVIALYRSRIGRKNSHVEFLRKWFKDRGVKLIALNTQNDESPAGFLQDNVQGIFDEYESLVIRERMRRGKLRKAKEGYVVGGHTPPYGYAVTESRETLVADTATQPWVKRIFRMVAVEGYALHAVKKVFDAEGVLTPGSANSAITGDCKYWQKTFIKRLIENDVYYPHTDEELDYLVNDGVLSVSTREKWRGRGPVGIWWYNTTKYEPLDERLPYTKPDGSKGYKTKYKKTKRPRKEWIAVPVRDLGMPRAWVVAARERIKDNRKPALKRNKKLWELSGGLTRCGHCGKNVYVNTIDRKNSTYRFYRCPTVRDNGAGSCEGGSWGAAHVESLVWEFVRKLLAEPSIVLSAVDATIHREEEASRGNTSDDHEFWCSQLDKATSKRGRYVEMYAEEIIDREERDQNITLIDSQIKSARNALGKIGNHKNRVEFLKRDREALRRSYERRGLRSLEMLTPEQRRRLYEILRIEIQLIKDQKLKGKVRGGKDTLIRVRGVLIEAVWGEEGCTFRDVVEIASMYNFTNRMSLACGMIPNEEYHALAR
jgi:site-specific DNA recombinase